MTARRASRWLLAVLFVAAGLNHFRDPAFYDAMIPAVLPWPRFWTLFTGAAEVAGGAGLFVPRLRKAAGWGLAAMLVGFLWVHVAMLFDPPVFGGEVVPAWLLWVRLVLQFPLIAWVLWASRDAAEPKDE